MSSRADVVKRLWAGHHGWAVGGWPRDRRYDAVLIQRSVNAERLGNLPEDFWRSVIDRVPAGARFTWLTTMPAPNRLSRLEEWALEWHQQRQPAPVALDVAVMDPRAAAAIDQLAGRLRMPA